MAREDVWVVVPTINERHNLFILVPRLLRLNSDWRILVVDDNSNDGTRDLLLGLCSKTERVEALLRNAPGFASALREGMAHALDGGALSVVTMDADLSHDPNAIPALLESGADLVLGSRYTEGGDILNWPLTRRIISLVANGMSRFSLGTTARDLTSGFRVYSRGMVELVLNESVSEGFDFQVEVIELAKSHQMVVEEIPITFRERRWGESKLSGREEFLNLLWTLANKVRRRMQNGGEI